ncbi:threonine/serine exporter family protein [Catenuloplanes japonicus]|uniref:hypothetical protein n=1 Tax=Catenuloplanes japonicus TaxID=33876 RepID=UPI00052536B9|nr:hypothetical protein [Catenuloplanes japonicus]
MTAPAEHRASGGQSFWSVVVGVPAIFSVLRLGVEAGGELQTTLLLVANVDPINLIAALFTTAARFVSATLVGVLAIGGVAWASRTPGQDRPALFARWLRASPLWFAVAAFGLAVITWQIMYLPLLLPCAVAAFQSIVTIPPDARWKVVMVVLPAFAGYVWLVGPTITAAVRQGDWLVFCLFVAPPLLALGVPGPLPRRFVGGLTLIAQGVALIMVAAAAIPMITTPVLPLTVTTVSRTTPVPSSGAGAAVPTASPGGPAAPAASTDPAGATGTDGPGVASNPGAPNSGASDPGASDPGATGSPGLAGSADTAAPRTATGPPDQPESGNTPPSGAAAGPGAGSEAGSPASGSAGRPPDDDPRDTEDILGHVITVDDVHMVILQESGGVRYVPTDLVQDQVLCPTEGELPRFRLWVRGFHVEDSLLEGLGRQVRPASRLDAACRNPVTG